MSTPVPNIWLGFKPGQFSTITMGQGTWTPDYPPIGHSSPLSIHDQTYFVPGTLHDSYEGQRLELESPLSAHADVWGLDSHLGSNVTDEYLVYPRGPITYDVMEDANRATRNPIVDPRLTQQRLPTYTTAAVPMKKETPDFGDDPNPIGDSGSGDRSNDPVEALPIIAWVMINSALSLTAMTAVRYGIESAAPGLSEALPWMFFADKVSTDWFTLQQFGTSLIKLTSFGILAAPVYAGLDAFRVKNPVILDAINDRINYRELLAAIKDYMSHPENLQSAKKIFNSMKGNWYGLDVELTEVLGTKWEKLKQYTATQLDGGILEIQELMVIVENWPGLKPSHIFGTGVLTKIIVLCGRSSI